MANHLARSPRANRPKRRPARATHFFFFLFIACASASAQAPKLGYAFPPAIEAGKSTDVQLGGYDFTIDLEWFIHSATPDQVKLKTLGPPGDYLITPPPYWVGPRQMSTPLPIPREVPAKLNIHKQAPAGIVRWQVANANGSSGLGVFYISRGNEIIESRSRDLPQKLPALPIGVSGRLSRLTEVDRYEITTEKDGPISIDLMARRLGSDFQGVLQVRDTSGGGSLVADFADTQGHDGGVTFAAKAGATYTISLHDADFRGDRGYVYRLGITVGPRVVCTIPAAGQRGSSREVEFILDTGKPSLESVKQTVAFPADASMTTHTHTLATSFGDVGVAIPLSDVNETLRGESRQAGGAIAIGAPVAVTAALPPGIDEHRYTFSAKKGEPLTIELQSRAIGGALDVSLIILGPDGKQLAESDDSPPTTDAALEFRAATDGEHTCIVRSMSTRGTAFKGVPQAATDEVYRLAIRPAAPDFTLSVPQQINLALGGKAELAVTANRIGGFDGEIALIIDGLPEGVTLAGPGPWLIGVGKKDLKIPLQSAADAAVVARALRVTGSAKIGESTITRAATAAAPGGNLAPRSFAESRIDAVMLAMTMTPPFEVLVIDRERQREINRGKTYLADLEIARKDKFTGEVRIEMSAAQARYRKGMRGPIISVPPGQTHAAYPIFLPEWLPSDVTQRMNVQGVAAVPDPKGTPRYLSKPADARITMIMEAALLKLSSSAKDLTVKPGEPFDVPVHLSRSAKLKLPATVELVVPDELKGVLGAEAINLAADGDSGIIRVTSKADAKLHGLWPLTFKATSLEDGKWPVVSQVDVEVLFRQ